MKWSEIKNIGGGYCYELMNAIEGMYTIAKFNRLARSKKEQEANDFMIGVYFKKLDEWGLPWSVQNDIMAAAYSDRSPGFPVLKIDGILRDYESMKGTL